MRKGGGHAKGAHFERVVAKLIVKAFKKFKINQRECWRSVNSGGHIIAAGDLEMSDRLMKLFPYAVECKFHRKIKWQNFLLGARAKKSQEQKWLVQAIEGSKKIKGLYPLLVMKENNGPIYAMSPDLTLVKFQELLKWVAGTEEHLRKMGFVD
jgi:hypothetical protein